MFWNNFSFLIKGKLIRSNSVLLSKHFRIQLYCTLERTNTENWKPIFPEKELRCHSHNFHIQVYVSDLYIPTNDLPVLLQEKNTVCGPILGIYESLTDT
jgi:hypothetical protein